MDRSRAKKSDGKEFASRFSSLSLPVVDMFPVGLRCQVTEEIPILDTGWVMANGREWRAEIYQMNCQTKLLVGQRVDAIGRRGTTLLVIPLHCIIWSQYLDEYGAELSPDEIEAMDWYERNWRSI